MCARERAVPCPPVADSARQVGTNKGIQHRILAGNRWFGKPCGWLPRRIGHPGGMFLGVKPRFVRVILKVR